MAKAPVALLSASLPLDPQSLALRALQPLLGEPLLLHQIEMVASAGISRVLIAAEGPSGGLARVIERARAAGLDVQAVHSPRDLSTKIGDAATLVMVGDGLFGRASLFSELVATTGPFIAIVDDDIRHAAHERVDVNHLWAGIACVPAALVHKLTDLPDDWNIESALLRQAVQSDLPRVRIADRCLDEGELRLVGDREAVIRAEHTALSWRGQGEATLAQRLVTNPLGRLLLEPLLAWGGGRAWLMHVPLGLLVACVGAAFTPWLSLVCLTGVAALIANELAAQIGQISPFGQHARWQRVSVIVGVTVTLLLLVLRDGMPAAAPLGLLVLAGVLPVLLAGDAFMRRWAPDPLFSLIVLSAGALSGLFTGALWVLVATALGLLNHRMLLHRPKTGAETAPDRPR